uniref:TIR domain-containing protein n=1 Tax=Neogobius melanostomus TaxID=47308 RepID=A0A8C6TNH7_9GOBI
MAASVCAVLLSLLILDITAGDDLDENGLNLCVTSKSQIQDLSRKNLTLVPSNLPGNTQYLDLSYNALRTLTEDAFSELRNLCFLKMADCGLTEIPPHTFEKTPLLKVLNVSQNRFAIIPDLSLQNIQILDLSFNLYKSYKLPYSYQRLKNLNILALGSTNANSVLYNDFDALQNVTLPHLILGSGTKWRSYESGAFAKLRLLGKISLKTTFCGNLDLLEAILVDLNQTQVTAMQFVHVFPDICNVSGNPFASIQSMPRIQNLTIENTWTNSSFMEDFLKSVWLSTIRELSLVNITYNEDTPSGFQLPNQNHTAAIQFITFYGINHYQYKYPTFNMSFELISNLRYIKFSRTGMNILPCYLISEIPNLETLDISDNLLGDTGFWWPGCSYTSVFPKLKQLSLSKNRFKSLSFIAEHTHQMKLLVSLDLSFNSISLDGVTHWPFWLKELNLGNNNLGDRPSPNSPNSLTCFSAATQFANAKGGNNPFVCSCDSFWFITSLNKSLLPDWPLQYSCSTPSAYAGKSLTAIEGLNTLSCETWLQAVLGLAVLFAIVAISGFIFMKCDGVWYSKMLWVWIQMKRRGQKRTAMLQGVAFQYHAFISYSHHDADWVDAQLVACLEGAGLTLCVHERDFVPGEWILDNIVKCVESSYKTLFHRSISVQQDSMVFILLEPIPADSLPKRYLRLRSVLKQQTYLEWPRDERKRRVFWASLKAMLSGANKFMVLKDVALGITETTTLIDHDWTDAF